VLLIGGWLRDKALLQILLEAAFEGVDRDGWLKLSRNWGVFFVFMAGLNEVLRLQLDFESWLWAKLWVFMPLSFLFTFSQIPHAAQARTGDRRPRRSGQGRAAYGLGQEKPQPKSKFGFDPLLTRLSPSFLARPR